MSNIFLFRKKIHRSDVGHFDEFCNTLSLLVTNLTSHFFLLLLQAMKGVTKAMMSMNNQMKLPEIQKIMMEFEKQTEMMDMKEEMMNDVIGEFFFVLRFSPLPWGAKSFYPIELF